MKKLLFSGLSFFLAVFISADNICAEMKKMSTVSGQITLNDGMSFVNGAILFFNEKTGPPPAPEKYWRIPDYGGPLAADGKFTINLIKGVYYIGAIRNLPERVGQPQEEDWLFISKDENGRLKSYVIKEDMNISLGIIRGKRYKISSNKKEELTVEGSVSDIEGKPVKGVIVEAFIPKESGRPIFSSAKTGSDGKYLIRVYEGAYYLKVRPIFQMGPQKGIPVTEGTIYIEKEMVNITAKSGEKIKGVNLTVTDLTRKIQ